MVVVTATAAAGWAWRSYSLTLTGASSLEGIKVRHATRITRKSPVMDRVSVFAITRNGVGIARRLREAFPDWSVHAPEKLSGGSSSGDGGVSWYTEPASQKMAELFGGSDAVVCIFSLGAAIRLAAPHMKDKKMDPAIVVIDDGANFVISALSGHIGGANELARAIAGRIGAVPVITTAADVNNTVAVDMVGRDLGWKIEDDSTVTMVSAHMVNGEPVGVFQDAGDRGWWKGDRLPGNVTTYDSMEEMRRAGCAACLIISDRTMADDDDDDGDGDKGGGRGLAGRSVVYRPPTLVIGVGVHHDTAKETITDGIGDCLGRFGLSPKSVARMASIRKPDGRRAAGLDAAAEEMGVPVEYIGRDELAGVAAPNPSETVRAFEGTASVSEAAAIIASRGGDLVVEKQKFPPDLTIAVARTGN